MSNKVEKIMLLSMEDMDEKIGKENRKRWCELNNTANHIRALTPEENAERAVLGKMVVDAL